MHKTLLSRGPQQHSYWRAAVPSAGEEAQECQDPERCTQGAKCHLRKERCNLFSITMKDRIRRKVL